MPLRKVRRIDFSPDEWLAGTVGMSLEEEGLYIHVCALIYSHGGPIEITQLKGKWHGNRLNSILKRLEYKGKIERSGNRLDQKRCRVELENAWKRLGKAQENGAKGGRPKGLAKPDGLPKEKPGGFNPSPSSSPPYPPNNYPTPSVSPDGDTAPPPDPVKELWDRGLAIIGKERRSLLGKLVKQYGQVAVLAAIVETENERPVDPVAYFIACCERRKSNGRTHGSASDAMGEWARRAESESLRGSDEAADRHFRAESVGRKGPRLL